jgi:hypothetical protein
MNLAAITAAAALACTCLLGAAEGLRAPADTRCEGSRAGAPDKNPHAAADNEIPFPIGGRPRFIMRRLPAPDGAIDFRILGVRGAPAILSLIGADPNTYADYTYDGANADMSSSISGACPGAQ